MLHYILKLDFESILMQLIIVTLCFMLTVLSSIIDYIVATNRAKRDGKKVHSYGRRQTCNKIVEYLTFLFLLFFIDTVNPIFTYFDVPTLPLCTIFGTIFAIYTEYKSVKEKASDKFRESLDKNPSEILDIIRKNKAFIKEVLEKEEK